VLNGLEWIVLTAGSLSWGISSSVAAKTYCGQFMGRQ
jgi:hypothetical protein